MLIGKGPSKEEGLKLNTIHQLVVYAHDVNLLKQNTNTLKQNTEVFLVASKNTDLEVNADNAKYMFKPCELAAGNITA
jgi:hypothetical protein